MLSPPVSRSTVSGLLLKVEELKAKQLLNSQQGGLLTHLAWQHDFSLLRVYERVRGWGGVGGGGWGGGMRGRAIIL